MSEALIYHLVDLDTWDVLYVGSTAQPPYCRLQQHVSEAARPEIKGLFESRRVGLEEIAYVARADRFEAERSEIAAAVAAGHRLVNVLLRGRADWQNLPL